jgi:lysophospholipase L1-like esterase
MRKKLIVLILGGVSAFLFTFEAQSQKEQGFYLKNGDTVVFYGDSITEQNLYNQYVELYAVTRFPGMKLHFVGAGNGGDKVTGGSAGTLDERLTRDVISQRPSVVTVMLGMNDGSYQPANREIESGYLRGYEHLLATLHEQLPGARITLLGPSAFDDVTRQVWFPGGYNAVLKHYADLDEGLARETGATFVNLNPPTVEMLEKAEALDPLLARTILPDRVHPDTVAHWAMALAILKRWNAPSLVSAVTLDAKGAKTIQAQGALVVGIESDKASLRWTETERSLPLPLTRGNADHTLILQLTDLQQQLNREMLGVENLAPGRYRLTIDDKMIGVFDAGELAKGINLADYETPMWSQAQRVGWMVADDCRAVYLLQHMRAHHDAADALQDYGKSLEASIYGAAAPMTHQFTLVPAEGASQR